MARFGATKAALTIGRALVRTRWRPGPGVSWRLVQKPTFDNQFATLRFKGRKASLRLERALPGDDPRLETSLERRLA